MSVDPFLRSWAWKREHRPDRDRFVRPYVHEIGTGEQTQRISIKQAKFKEQGFASTVWDSSIVASKYLERWAADKVAGKRCLDLSAGCGLVACVLARLGAGHVVATDLGPNLPLLRTNCEANAPGHVAVVEHEWGTDIYRPADGPLSLPFDLVVACDVMYVHEAVPALMDSLLQLARNAESAHRGSEDSCCLDAGHHCCEVIVAHGRNRPAEELFVTTAKREGFDVQEVPGRELDEVYQCSDVTVLRLLPLRNGARGS